MVEEHFALLVRELEPVRGARAQVCSIAAPDELRTWAAQRRSVSLVLERRGGRKPSQPKEPDGRRHDIRTGAVGSPLDQAVRVSALGHVGEVDVSIRVDLQAMAVWPV